MLVVAALGAGHAAAQPDPERRAYLKCAGCHGIDDKPNTYGPPLAGVYGRKAGSTPGYQFSKAWTASNVVWNDRTLEAMLADPRGYIRGSKKVMVPVKDANERRALIGYLKRLAARPAVKPAAASGR